MNRQTRDRLDVELWSAFELYNHGCVQRNEALMEEASRAIWKVRAELAADQFAEQNGRSALRAAGPTHQHLWSVINQGRPYASRRLELFANDLDRSDSISQQERTTQDAGSNSRGSPEVDRTAEAVPHTASVSAAAAGAVDATKIYGSGDSEVRALDGVTVAFEVGKFTAIMGPSGSGKSTLMHSLAGLDGLTSGAVYIGDTYLAALKDKDLTELRREKVGFIFQAYNLIPTLTADENIRLPLLLGGAKGDEAFISRVIDAVGLRGRLKHRPSELSGGQQQRVAVARALASKPTIIFADEPTGNLDSRSGAEILDFMRRAVNELGQTIVMVTHDPVAASYADRVIFLADGKIVNEMIEPTAEKVLDLMKRLGDDADRRQHIF